MPLMAPLSDILGISRETAVFAFTCGDGFSNSLIPTSGVLMAMLSLARTRPKSRGQLAGLKGMPKPVARRHGEDVRPGGIAEEGGRLGGGGGHDLDTEGLQRTEERREVVEALAEETGWSASTVKTLLRRLVEKGHLATEPVGSSFLYSPARPPLGTLRRISLPLIGANLAAGAILAFAFAMLEVGDSLILAQQAEHVVDQGFQSLTLQRDAIDLGLDSPCPLLPRDLQRDVQAGQRPHAIHAVWIPERFVVRELEI